MINRRPTLLLACLAALHCPLPARAQDAAPAEAAGESFDVWEIRVVGNGVLANREIEEVVYPFLGPQRTIATVEQARVALETRYRDRGYGTVFVDIPEQDVDGGIVRLRVTEGKLDRIRVVGSRYYSNRAIRNRLPSLQRGEVLQLTQFQEQLTALNRQSRDRSIVPVLRAGSRPGNVDVDLKVTDKLPMHATAEVNNKYTANTSHSRANLTWSFDNLWQRMHSLSLQYQTAPEEPREARVLAGTYVLPVTDSGHMFAVFAVDTDSEFTTLGAEFNEFGVIGRGRIYGARYIAPLAGTNSYFHNVTFGADYKDFQEVITQEDGEPAATPISYINWSFGYTGTLRSAAALTMFDLSANLGIRGLANSPEEFHFKRFSGQANKGEPDYFYIRGSARQERPLVAGLALFGQLSGQYSPHALISNEQFAIGGAEGVRGYLESQALGDYGASGTLELRWGLPQSWLGASPRQATVFVFADAGIIALQYALKDQVDETTLASWGVGVNLSGFFTMRGVGGLSSSLSWARALRDAKDVDAGDSRLHFQVGYGF
ncbi:MAG TPA: ShlB/FhaC/HecB family hemolysin secretion/activation protein [Steroidobacteraceae bacterium]|nr:ShlB/FhaC/HecB family hemolysin secretion/activation protein [Steroidobacteraceae bacterium]